MKLHVGVHPNNLHLCLAERWQGAFAGLDVAFVPYPEGRDSARLLAEGAIDLCGTGSTPPILAQAAGLDVVYVAASAPRPANGGIVVALVSSIRSVAGLKGARIALLDGSFHTYLLARVLETADLRLGDVRRVELPPAASLLALGSGEVDAWVAMAPLLDQSIQAGHAVLLAPCGDAIPNRSVFWTLARRQVPPGLLDAFAAGLARLGHDIAARPDQAAALLADANGVDLAAWRPAVDARDWSIGPADASVIAEQQAEADTLLRHGDLPHAIDLARAAR